MERHPCGTCGKLYSSEADRCPHCGAPSPTPASEYIFRGTMALGCFLVLCAVAFVVFAVVYITR
jgi:hypothetical protein